ncbi:hypothetical protein D3C73_1133940 [compost metagenome]
MLLQIRCMLLNQFFQWNNGTSRNQFRICCDQIGEISTCNHNPQFLLKITHEEFHVQLNAKLFFDLFVYPIILSRRLVRRTNKSRDVQNFLAVHRCCFDFLTAATYQR